VVCGEEVIASENGNSCSVSDSVPSQVWCVWRKQKHVMMCGAALKTKHVMMVVVLLSKQTGDDVWCCAQVFCLFD
jgi:hypothetical protein